MYFLNPLPIPCKSPNRHRESFPYSIGEFGINLNESVTEAISSLRCIPGGSYDPLPMANAALACKSTSTEHNSVDSNLAATVLPIDGESLQKGSLYT